MSCFLFSSTPKQPLQRVCTGRVLGMDALGGADQAARRELQGLLLNSREVGGEGGAGDTWAAVQSGWVVAADRRPHWEDTVDHEVNAQGPRIWHLQGPSGVNASAPERIISNSLVHRHYSMAGGKQAGL